MLDQGFIIADWQIVQRLRVFGVRNALTRTHMEQPAQELARPYDDLDGAAAVLSVAEHEVMA